MKTIFSFLLCILTALLLTRCDKETDPNEQVEIPDNTLLDALIEEGIDTNGDGLISYGEASEVTRLSVHRRGISDMAGIEAFVNLETLHCYCNEIEELDVSNNIALSRLWCGGNQLTSLDVSNNVALESLEVSGNQLHSLDVSNLKLIRYLDCSNNLLANLFFSRNYDLESLDCSNNLLPFLNVSETFLRILECDSNQITDLDVSKNIRLEYLHCQSNLLSSLDVSRNRYLNFLSCGSNQLSRLDISRNHNLGTIIDLYDTQPKIKLDHMPSLYEVCVWTMPFPPDSITIDTTGSPNVIFKMDCSK